MCDVTQQKVYIVKRCVYFTFGFKWLIVVKGFKIYNERYNYNEKNKIGYVCN